MKRNINDIKKYIRTFEDFPIKGVTFRDCIPIFLNPDVLKDTTELLIEACKDFDYDVIAAPESRGFLFGLPFSMLTNKPLVLVRKPGKIPPPVLSQTYDLEYGQDSLQIHEGDLKVGQKVLIVDDVLATGGTAAAIANLVKKAGATPVGYGFIIELEALKGKDKLPLPHVALIKY